MTERLFPESVLRDLLKDLRYGCHESAYAKLTKLLASPSEDSSAGAELSGTLSEASKHVAHAASA